MRERDRIRVARIIGPHGVHGAMKLQVFLEEPEAIWRLQGLQDTQGRLVRLLPDGISGSVLIARIEGIESREAVRKMDLFVPRAALPDTEEGEFYESDLVGLAVMDEAGATLGKVQAVADFGAGPLIEVKPAEGGATVFLPFTETVVPEVDPSAGVVKVRLSPGLWPGR